MFFSFFHFAYYKPCNFATRFVVYNMYSYTRNYIITTK